MIVSVRGEGLSGSQGFQEFPTTTTGRVETTRYCIVLTFDCFALSASCCIDKTHRCSHGQAMHAESPSTIQFFSLLPYCCVNINGVPALAIINKYEGGGFCLATIGWIGRRTQRLFVSTHQIRQRLLCQLVTPPLCKPKI